MIKIVEQTFDYEVRDDAVITAVLLSNGETVRHGVLMPAKEPKNILIGWAKHLVNRMNRYGTLTHAEFSKYVEAHPHAN